MQPGTPTTRILEAPVRAADETTVVALLAAVVLAAPPALAAIHAHGPVCAFRAITGWPCPGCGFTRSLQAVWRGDLSLAVRYHPMGPALFVLCAVTVLARASAAVDGRCWSLARSWVRVLLSRRAFAWSVALVMAVWLVRLAQIAWGGEYLLW